MAYWDAALGEVERVGGFEALDKMITQAALNGTAWHNPSGLAEERRHLHTSGRLPGPIPEGVDAAAVTDEMLQRLALADRVARRKRRRGEADPFLKVMRGD